MNGLRLAVVVGAMLLALSAPAQAQLGGFLDKVLPPALRGGATDANPASNAPAGVPRDAPSAASATGAPSALRRKDVTAELQPDRECKRPQERFNIAEKVVEYGGTEARLRLERLISSDFRYDELTQEDREMLQYLARTTVWLPVEVESRLGSLFDLTSGRANERGGNELDRGEWQDKIEKRADQLRAAVPDFPGRIKFTLSPDLPDGAQARFGGVIQLSTPFLQAISANQVNGDVVLAHELSHVYKRHAIKQMQFQLLSTDEGWDLARKVLQRALRGASVDPIRDGMFVMTTVPQIFGFVRSMQLQFTREQEFEADACAVVWLRAIDADPTRAWEAFVATMVGTASQPSSYARSHPPTGEREANYRNKVARKATASDRTAARGGERAPEPSQRRK